MNDYDLEVNCVSGGPGTGERGYGNCLLMVILFEATQVSPCSLCLSRPIISAPRYTHSNN